MGGDPAFGQDLNVTNQYDAAFGYSFDYCLDEIGAEFKSLKANLASQGLKWVPANSEYLNCVQAFWRARGLYSDRMTPSFAIASLALDLCDVVHVYGLWPFESLHG